MTLHVHDWGAPDAPPLLCLHGVTSWGGRFRRLAEERLDAFHVFAPDLRGHGVSEWEPPWNLGTHIGDLIETLDALHLDRVDVVGHSFGGRLALELAARWPERVHRLVLPDPAVWVPPPVALERDRRRHPHRWVEQDETVNTLRPSRGELECEATAEAVADDVDAVEVKRVEGLDQITDVGPEVPRLLPLGNTVPSQVRREHVECVEPLLREPAKAAAPARDAVEAQKRRRVGRAPVVH